MPGLVVDGEGHVASRRISGPRDCRDSARPLHRLRWTPDGFDEAYFEDR